MKQTNTRGRMLVAGWDETSPLVWTPGSEHYRPSTPQSPGEPRRRRHGECWGFSISQYTSRGRLRLGWMERSSGGEQGYVAGYGGDDRGEEVRRRRRAVERCARDAVGGVGLRERGTQLEVGFRLWSALYIKEARSEPSDRRSTVVMSRAIWADMGYSAYFILFFFLLHRCKVTFKTNYLMRTNIFLYIIVHQIKNWWIPKFHNSSRCTNFILVISPTLFKLFI
jgi:hypothetical protein